MIYRIVLPVAEYVIKRHTTYSMMIYYRTINPGYREYTYVCMYMWVRVGACVCVRASVHVFYNLVIMLNKGTTCIHICNYFTNSQQYSIRIYRITRVKQRMLYCSHGILFKVLNIYTYPVRVLYIKSLIFSHIIFDLSHLNIIFHSLLIIK